MYQYEYHTAETLEEMKAVVEKKWRRPADTASVVWKTNPAGTSFLIARRADGSFAGRSGGVREVRR